MLLIIVHTVEYIFARDRKRKKNKNDDEIFHMNSEENLAIE